MTENATSKRIHPLVAGAAVSVILVSMVGVAAITGLLPSSSSTPAANLPLAASLGPNAQQGVPESQLASAAERETQPQVAHDANTESKKNANHASSKPVNQHAAKPAYQSDNGYAANSAPVQQICESCGVVESVRAVEHQAEQGSGLGAVAGAVLGGVLGNQVGGGNGRTLATVAGAVGGGYAGNTIEKRTHTTTTYEVRVKMENGNTRTFTPSTQPEWHAGDRVRVNDGRLISRG
ncbi:glycine zipper 2TM domain-containing protein [Undibacterium sp. Ren11W]|uniref:glycine zipper 2TM domain-containing protein n=1 Tax=Undibacterium sp. Ren11W TaxID=3413045 RepID=UPI003BF34C1D